MKNPLTPLSHRMRSRYFNPWKSLAELESEMERLVTDRISPSSLAAEFADLDYSPPCEFSETDKQYTLKLDVPGVKKQDIDIEVEDNYLKVSGERKHSHEQRSNKKYISEIYEGAFMRSFTLPSSVNKDSVDASYDDGVLTITIMKSQPSKSKHVEVH